MSNKAKRYSSGTPESRVAKRTNGKQITRVATRMLGKERVNNSRSANNMSDKTRQIFLYIKDMAAQAEIIRRVDVIRAELVRQILAPGGHPLLGGDFITYINLLIQLPVLVFIYKKEGHQFTYRQHFDFKKFKFSRGSLQLVEQLHSQTKTEIKDVELNDLEVNESNRKKLFRVYSTDFYVRCFLLDTRKDDQPFFAVTEDTESSLNVHYEYVRVGLQSLLDQDAKDFTFYSDSFRNAIFSRIRKILEDFIYVQPSSDRGEKTLNIAQVSSELDVLNYFANGGKASYKKEGLYKDFSVRLNNSIEDAAFSASILKKNEVNSNKSLGKDVPNMFIMLRAYVRNNRRAAIDGVFCGYAYNTRFNISISQRDKIETFLKKLVALGKDGYQKLGGKNNELYGGYRNDKTLLWDFGGTKDKNRDASYRKFAESLDNWFWRNLKSVDFLIRAFLSPVGSQSVSIVDPVFYYGASIYRMPFRRLGGLERLKGLSELYDQLGEVEKKNFSFEMLGNVSDITKRNELKKDCVRVVIFYYLTRLLATNDGNQAELDTKVHLYPIDVGGVIVGAVGKVSYDFKPRKRKPESLKLPTTRQTWDEEVMFLNSVVLPIRASLRRQYRDLQIEYLVNQFHMELTRIVENCSNQPTVDFDTVIINFERLLNKASLSISRVCPYPSVTFSFQKAPEPTIDAENRCVVNLGEVKLIIKQDEIPSVFRFLTRQEKRMAYDVSRPLALRFWESARYLLL